MALACLLPMLSACVSSGSKGGAQLPDIPADVRQCFNQIVPKPPAGAMTDGDVILLVSKLKRSEAQKTDCGRRLIAWYDDIRSRWNARP